MIPKMPPRPAPAALPARAPEPPAPPPLPEKSLVDVVQALANEALERAQRDKRGEERDKRVDDRAERIAKGIETLVLMQQLSAASSPPGKMPVKLRPGSGASIYPRSASAQWALPFVVLGVSLALLAGLLFGALYHAHS